MELSSDFTLTEFGLIPIAWRICSFGEVFSITAGGDVDLERTRDLHDNQFPYPVYSNALVNSGLYGYSSLARHPADSITITARGMVGSANHRDHEYTAIGRVLVLQSKQSYDGRFFAAFINSRISFANESTGVPQLTAPQVSTYSLPVPPLEEQRAIATALSDVDALIAGLERLITKKRDIKQAAMQQLLTGQTRLPGFSGEWSRRRLGELADMGSGGTPPAGNPGYYGGSIPWVAISDMTQAGRFIEYTERSLSDSGLSNSAAQLFPAGTVLYAMYASLGECSIACMELCTSQAILGIRPRTGLVRDFLYYSLISRREFVKTLGQQGTQSNLNKSIVQSFEIHLPAPDEQTAIATVFSDMDADLSALESRLAKTRAIKQGMMQELLTGRTRLI